MQTLCSRGLVLVGRITMGFHAKNWIHLLDLFFASRRWLYVSHQHFVDDMFLFGL